MKDKSRRLPAPEGGLDFTPVPRKSQRHDGWTPERQKAFIGALADTGCVAIAARMVNMTPESAYMLRRAPGAESFRRAWEAAQGFGLQAVKDEAFDRAMNGQLVPVFVAGKLMGFRRRKNDRLLMFILRHYGQDSQGRKTTINYFSTRATAAAGAGANPLPLAGEGEPRSGEGEGARGETRSVSAAEASTTTVKTVISGDPGQAADPARQDEAADLLNAFEGVDLDDTARAEIHRALEAAADRRRALRVDWDTPRDEALARQAADERCAFIRVAPGSVEYLGELESGVVADLEPFREGEPHWESIGEPVPEWYRQWARDQGAECEAIGEQGEESPLPGQPAPEGSEGDRTDVTNSVRDACLLPPPENSSPSLLGGEERSLSGGQASTAGRSLGERACEAVRGTADRAARCEASVRPGAGGGVAPAQPAASSPQSPVPSPPTPKRPYKKRTPKPPFTVPDEARKAQAMAEVEAERAKLRKPVDRRRKPKPAAGGGRG